MAKIPRIEQGDRPSAVRDVMPADPTGVALAGALAGVSEVGLDIATKDYLREQQKRAEAMDRIQKIEDASDAGRITSAFENDLFALEDSVKKEFPDSTEDALGAFNKRAQELAPQTVDKGRNDFVKLAVAQHTQTSISSGQSRLHTWAVSRKVSKIKGNLAVSRLDEVRSARSMGKPGLELSFAKIDADPQYDMVFGEDAPLEREKQKAEMTKANVETMSEYAPASTGKALEDPNGFYALNLMPDDLPNLKAKTIRDGKNLEDKAMFTTLGSFGAEGDRLLKAISVGEADAATIAEDRTKLEAKRRAIVDDVEKTPEATARLLAEVEKHKKFLDSAEKWMAQNTAPEYVSTGNAPRELLLEREKVLTAEEPSVSALLTYRQNVLNAALDRRMSPGQFNTFSAEIALKLDPALNRLKDKTGFWAFLRSDEQQGSKALKDTIEMKTYGEGISPKQEMAAYEIYIQKCNDHATRPGGDGTVPLDNRLKYAKQAYYYAVGMPVPKALR